MGLTEYIKTNRLRAIFVLTLVVATQVTTTIVTYLTSSQINAIAKGQFTLFIEILVLQFVFSQICNASYNFANVQNAIQTQNLFHQVRNRMLHHFYKEPATKVSEMENHLGNDLQILQQNYYQNAFNFACDFIYVILTIGTLFTFHWILVADSLIITLLAILAPRLMEKYTNRKTEQFSKENSKFLNLLEKWFNGLNELRHFGDKLVLKNRVAEQSQQLEQSEYEHDFALILVGLVTAIFDIAGRVSVPFIAGILFYQHQLTLGDILTAGYFANGIFYSVSNSLRTYANLKSTKTLRQKIASLQSFKEEPAVGDLNKVEQIEVKNLTVKYPNEGKISYPDFVINSGEKVLLTGDSGTGKSTLLKAMLGLIKPASGEIWYLDRQNRQVKIKPEQIGYLAQDLVMFPGTIKDNITMYQPKLNNQVDKMVEQIQFAADANRFNQGLATNIDPERNLLSGGQKQKVVLMRALIHKKEILFLDEATSAIDQKATSQILKNLVRTNHTIVMVAHNLSPEQKKLFDREICLKGEK